LAPIPERSCPSVQADASSLIARFGDNADYEAGDRAQRSTVIDSDRPRGHWTRVKIEIAKRRRLRLDEAGRISEHDPLAANFSASGLKR
jgi:hypothetical protein